MNSKLWTSLAPITLSLAWPLAALAVTGCKKEEPPPPPLPVPKPTAVATAPIELKPIDAGGEPDAAAAKKPAGGMGRAPAGASGLEKCCAALGQNAMSAPANSRMYMMQAASMCQAAAAQGKDKATMLTMITGALKGAGVPAACK